MAHVKGHIVKLANISTQLNSYSKSGDFFHYIIKVKDFEGQESRFRETDSYEPERSDSQDRPFGPNIVVLSKSNYDLSYLKEGEQLDIILMPQFIFNYASNWSLDGRSNWVVFEPAIQISHL